MTVKNIQKTIFLLMLALFSGTVQAQDTDGDAVLNTIDLDDDNDGILDAVECSSPL